MTAFARWLLARRHWLIVMAIAFAPVLPVFTVALMVLDAIKQGPARSFTGALIALAGVTVLAIATRSSMPVVVAAAALSLFSGVALGGIFKWAGSLNLAFQAAVLGSFVLATVAALVGPDAETLLRPTLNEVAEMMRASGATTEQLEALSAVDPEFILGLFLAAVFAQIVGALFLACWWYSLVEPETHFGIQFRALALGRVLGIGAMVLLTAGLVSNTALIQNLMPMAFFTFLFQGLAVMHAWGYAKKWHPLVLALAYVLVITPLGIIVVTVLSMVGLLDNVFSLRSPLRG